jgi:Toprim-like/Protein of unknown function (DUF3991)
MTDPELETFKTAIDLRAYAAGQGYALDQRESWRGCSVMRSTDGSDKIIVKRDDDGHYVYFSVHNENDSGSIIDFIQQRRRLNLGAVRKELRAWSGTSPPSLPSFPALPKTGKDRISVESQFGRMLEAGRHPYLESDRGIPPALLELPRFAGRIRIDDKGNTVFPHFDQQGLCGYEIKNRGYTGFARGGAKGLWSSHEEGGDTRLVFCESAIDALSHAALFPAPSSRYASIGGQVNPQQPELIRAAVARMPDASEIVAAMDADTDGRKLAEIVRQAVSLSGRSDLHFEIEEPAAVKDWNDALRGRSIASLPYRPSEGSEPSPK